MNNFMSAAIVALTMSALGSMAIGQDSIAWSKAADGALPKARANDTRPTILYFTFDT